MSGLNVLECVAAQWMLTEKHKSVPILGVSVGPPGWKPAILIARPVFDEHVLYIVTHHLTLGQMSWGRFDHTVSHTPIKPLEFRRIALQC